MSEVGTLRRFYLLKRLDAKRLGELALSAVWQSKQEAVSSTTLPDGFPSKAALSAIGYVAAEDLEGADVDELAMYVNLSRRQAEAVIAAHAAL